MIKNDWTKRLSFDSTQHVIRVQSKAPEELVNLLNVCGAIKHCWKLLSMKLQFRLNAKIVTFYGACHCVKLSFMFFKSKRKQTSGTRQHVCGRPTYVELHLKCIKCHWLKQWFPTRGPQAVFRWATAPFTFWYVQIHWEVVWSTSHEPEMSLPTQCH